MQERGAGGPAPRGFLDGCGAWIRTKDLRVMSPTSCRCSTPRRPLYPPVCGESGTAPGLVEAAAALGFQVPLDVQETFLARLEELGKLLFEDRVGALRQ